MSLWAVGCSSETTDLEAPSKPPPPSHTHPRLYRSVISYRFVKVACGGAHAMAITHDGRLYAFGWNAFGQCGLGEEAALSVHLPRAVGVLTGRTVAEVACGAAHTLRCTHMPTHSYTAQTARCMIRGV